MIQTTQEELELLSARFFPVFQEYVRRKSIATGDIELAASLDGIYSLPAGYDLGGVQKTVRVPLKLLTAKADGSVAACEAAAGADAAAARVDGVLLDLTEERQQMLAATAGAEAATVKTNAARESIEAGESGRVESEKSRVAAEIARQAEHEVLKSESIVATGSANAAADTANAAADRVDESILDLSEEKRKALEAAGDARTQADYAKQEGDKAAALTNDVRYLEANKLEGLAVENDLLYGVIGGELVGDGIAMPSGGGGGGGGAVGSVLRVKNLSGTSVTVAEGQAVVIRYSFSSLDSEDNTPTGDGTAEYYVNNIKVVTETIAQEEISKDITRYLTKGVNSVKLTVTDSYGASRSLNIKAEVVDVSLSSTFDDSQPLTGEFTFRYTPVGAMEKVIHFLLDGVEIATNTTTLTLREVSQAVPAQTHGSHTLEVYATATVNGVDIESARLYYDLICLEEGDATPVIASNYHAESVMQFDTLGIPFHVYSPSSSNSEVTLWVNGVQTGTRTVDRSLQTWTYRAPAAGELTLEIRCGIVTKAFHIHVTALSIDVEAETQDLELYLSSQNRSNSDANKTEWKSGDTSAVLTGFNWKTNGWIPDDNGYSCLRVGSGASVAIPLHLFGEDFRAGGKTIELEFVVRDVYHYDTPVISCWSGNRGIKITAQDALMKSEQSEVSTVFKDGERVRIAFVVQKRALNRLINIYVNGINSQSVQYPDADNFMQTAPVGITIGGADATVDLYTVRSYRSDLNRYQLLDNYIADMDDVSRKLVVYERNKIYDSYGAVNINALNKFIPVMTIIGDLPQYKGDKKTVRVIYTDMAHPEKSFTADGVQIDVQGTSSQYYPRKNYKLKFKNGFTMTVDGSHADGYTLSGGDCLPATVFCTKADFAESSGTHNTGIANYADWLLKRMGILTGPQETNAVVRTTVYGEPCCMAHRATAESESEFIGKYNFNTDKAAENTFGFAGGDESWEFRNNTSDRVLFKMSDYSTDDWQNDFEARYPEDSINYTKLKEITDWIVSCGTDVEKFKAGLPQHMDKTQVVFYWLFTFIFGMVDQRAKNMFLTLYQDRLWLFILYDNDTCLGINNEGAISFKYNIEIHDVLGSKAVWNGADSALWNLVEQAYPDEIKSMYYTMRQQNYLTYDKVTEFLNTRQSDKWSEAIFNEDGYFKYEKPLVDGYLDYSQSTTNPQLVRTGAYLYALQGSREMHRKWWMANRLNYLDSKYLAGAILSDTAVFRTYTPSEWTGVEPCADITLTAFSAMYLNVKWGSVTKSQRVGVNETYKMTAPAGMTFNDTETIIYGASLISSLGDLSPLYVGSVDVSKMLRLKELIVGSAAEGYSNTNFTVMSVGNNKMLRKVDVQNCPNLVQPVDLSGCDNIEEILAKGTRISAVIPASAGILKRIHLPETITNLTIKNQPLLTDDGLILDGVGNIATLVLENVVINVFALLERCLNSVTPALSRVRLVGIQGSSDTPDILYKLSGIGGVDENGYNVDRAVLTGTFHVTAIREDKLQELNSMFPELTVTYDELSYPPSVVLNFVSSKGKTFTSPVFECSKTFVRLSAGSYKIWGELGEDFTYKFSSGNHLDATGTVTISRQEETREVTAGYIPLRAIKVYKYDTSTPLAGATVIIGEDTYTTNASGAVPIRSAAPLAGTVTADNYNDASFSFADTIEDDTSTPVYLYPYATATFTVKDENGNLMSGATVTVDGKNATTDSNGVCTIALKAGTKKYVATSGNYVGGGNFTMTTDNISVPEVITLDVSALKPVENGNIQMMLVGPSVQVKISSTTTDYIINWGDGTQDVATGTGSRTYTHTYDDSSYRQVEIGGCTEVTSANSVSANLIAYWSIGGSKVTGLHFSAFTRLAYVGLVFKNEMSRTDIRECFFLCYALASIPQGLFDNCAKVTDFYRCFYDCSALVSIPEGLFDNCAKVTSFEYCFHNCSALVSIPQGLFDNCANVTSFSYCFSSCSALVSIPEGLFDNCANVTSFSYCFSSCSALVSIPQGLFDNCAKVTDFYRCFYDCSALVSIPEGLFDNCPNVANFNRCFYDCSALVSNIPALWIQYYDKSLTKTDCFTGCVKAANWAIVPKTWGGPGDECVPYEGDVYVKIFKDSQWWLNQNVAIGGTTFIQQTDGSYSGHLAGMFTTEVVPVSVNDLQIGTITLLGGKSEYIVTVGDSSGMYESATMDYTTGEMHENNFISNDGWAYDPELKGLRSRGISNSASTSVVISTGARSEVTICYGQSSEKRNDYCTIYDSVNRKLIDLGTLECQGDNLICKVLLSDGILKFSYHKDGSVVSGKDAFWIKSISMEIMGIPPLPSDFIPGSMLSGVVRADYRALNVRLSNIENKLGLYE